MTHDEALVIFGLESDADSAMLKTVYHRRMRAIHPDLGPSADQVWRTVESARLSSAYTVLTDSAAAGKPAPARSSGPTSSAPASSPRSASAPRPTRKTSGPTSSGSRPAAFSGPGQSLSGSPLARIFHFATADTIGRWVALAIAAGLALLVEGPSSHGLIVLLLAGSLLVLQAGLGARGLSSPSGLLAGALRFGVDSVVAILSGLLHLTGARQAQVAGARRMA